MLVACPMAVDFKRYLLIALGALVLACMYSRARKSLGFYPRFGYVDFREFNNSVPSSEFIVPNIVHFLRFGPEPVTFIDAVCLLAAWKNQKPDAIYIHTDQRNFTGGPYWDVVRSQVGRKVEIVHREKPIKVFGKSLSKTWRNGHAGDVARLLVLLEYGGIFLDNDSYIVRSLDDFRRFEMTLGWQSTGFAGFMPNHVIVAHRNARFLRLWLESYKDYRRDLRYYNARDKPTREILKKQPHLIHRVKSRLAEYFNTPFVIYLTKNEKWRDQYAIHLLIRNAHTLRWKLSNIATYPVVFNEKNILNYDVIIKYMALDVYPFNKTGFSWFL